MVGEDTVLMRVKERRRGPVIRQGRDRRLRQREAAGGARDPSGSPTRAGRSVTPRPDHPWRTRRLPERSRHAAAAEPYNRTLLLWFDRRKPAA